MKALVVFYSRTGTTKKVAEALSKNLACDIEEIFDTRDRSGALGYLLAGKDAALKALTTIKKAGKDPAAYDVVIIGTPVWSFTVSTPVRTYLSENKVRVNEAAFFYTCGGTPGNTFKEMEDLCGKKPVALLELRTKEVMDGAYADKVNAFVRRLLGPSQSL